MPVPKRGGDVRRRGVDIARDALRSPVRDRVRDRDGSGKGIGESGDLDRRGH